MTAPTPRPLAPKQPPVPDDDTSVAGEEDPGAAMDMTGVDAPVSPAPPPSAPPARPPAR